MTAAMKLQDACSWKESYDKPRQHIKKQRHHFADKGLYRQNYDFSNSPIQIWDLDHKEDLGLKNSYFWIVVLGKTLGLEGDQKVNPKGNQPWTFIGRTDAEAEAPILWSPDANSQLTGKEGSDEGIDSMSTTSVQFSSVVSDSLRPHELQHARPPCPSTTPGVYPNSCP